MKLKHIVLLVLFTLGIKLAYLVFSIVINGSNPSLTVQYFDCVKKNDSHWYQKIATKGYPKITNKRDLGFSEGPNYKQSEWAFFPLYPKLIASTSQFFNVTFDYSALIWSVLFSILSILGIYWFGCIFFKDKTHYKITY